MSLLLHFLFISTLVILVFSRLPKTLKPMFNRYHLIFSEDIFKGETDEYIGVAYISFGWLGYNVNEVQVYADLDYLNLTDIFVNEYEVKNYEYNETNKIIKMTFPVNLNVTNGLMLYINYKGILSNRDSYGLYRASYYTKDGWKYFLVTRFAPVFARRVLPSFDEPTFRSSFEFYISHPDSVNVLGNKLGDIVNITDIVNVENSSLVTTHFNSTGNLSPHNVAFVISDFTCSQMENSKNVTSVDTFRVCSRETEKEMRPFALEQGAKLIQVMNNFTNWPFSLLGSSKLDFLAIPDYPLDCSAHLGLIICREDLLLSSEADLSQASKTKIIKNLAKQVSQMWFGNLIVLTWWDDKSFYEDAFAGYFEYFLCDQVYPEMSLWDTFVTQVIPETFIQDSYQSSKKLQGENVETDVEIFNQYQNDFSYKGAILLRMVEGIMGFEAFKTGVQYFVSSNKNRNPIVMDFWNILNPQIDHNLMPSRFARLYEIMDTWTNQPGFPLIKVTVDEGSLYPYNPRKIVLSQERFIFDGQNETAKWFVPLAYSFSSDATQFSNSTPKSWLNLTSSQLEIRYPWTESYAVFDNGVTGFYLTHLDDVLWINITKTLNDLTYSQQIPELSKNKIINDAFQMVKINKRNYTEVFQLIEFLKDEESIITWEVPLKEFKFLLEKVGHGTAIEKALSNHVSRLLPKIYNTVPWSNVSSDYKYSEKQVEILNIACQVEMQDCIDNALAINEQTIESFKDLKSLIYCTQIKQGKNNTLWESLFDLYEDTEDFSLKLTILEGLSCTADEDFLFELLSFASMEHTPATFEESVTIFKSVIFNSEIGLRVAFDFFKKNHDVVIKRFGSQYCVKTIIVNILENVGFFNQDLMLEIRNFIRNFDFPQVFKNLSESEIEKSIFTNKWLENHRAELYEYYSLDADADKTTSSDSSSTSTSTTPSTIEPTVGPSSSAKALTNSLSTLPFISFFYFVYL